MAFRRSARHDSTSHHTQAHAKKTLLHAEALFFFMNEFTGSFGHCCAPDTCPEHSTRDYNADAKHRFH